MEKQSKDPVTEEEVKTGDESEDIEIIDSEEAEPNKEEELGQDELQKKLALLEQEKDDLYQKMLRTQAEFDNFKKRKQKEREADLKYKSQDLANEVLPALDNFERALQVEVTEANASFVEGITMVYRQLNDALKSQGIDVIETVGKEFDPNLHHAVMQVEDEEAVSNTVIEELQKGYILKDRVIRPAMVKVNK
ncbi:nucleotide exchange factor GrpE [Virgibacillus sp. C22-A2]|uniref:Protein GrpE n=1 Tax=Virgibacillus tibetensis TaxID=3042313 RepID=A0ABU6KAC5_9BACI|nr:nucleotide exchange factor GrpE [Virgibacillus sp. C22-A2]